MELNQLAAAVGPAVLALLLLLQALEAQDVGLGPFAAVFGGSAFILGWTAPELTPAVLGAVAAGFITLLVGVVLTLSTVSRGRRVIGVFNFFCAFAALVVAIAAAGVEFDPEMPLKLYNLFAGRED